MTESRALAWLSASAFCAFEDANVAGGTPEESWLVSTKLVATKATELFD